MYRIANTNLSDNEAFLITLNLPSYGNFFKFDTINTLYNKWISALKERNMIAKIMIFLLF